MMASIPNMRSTPLPAPTGKAAPVDPASAGFTMPLPAVPVQLPPPVPVTGQPAQPVPPVVIEPVIELAPDQSPDRIAPHIVASGEPVQDDADEAPKPKAKTDEEDAAAVPTVVIPFLPVPPATPTPQNAPAVAAEDAAPLAPAGAVAPPPVSLPAPAAAGTASPPATDAHGGKQALPVPADVEDGPAPVDAEIEAAVKALIQRKPAPGKQVAAPPRTATGDTTKASDPAQPPAAPRPEPSGQASAAPVAAQAATSLPVAEAPQPALAPVASQPAPAAAEKGAIVDATRSTELATERKLDLARDSAWLDRLARDIARAASDDTPLRFRLHPQTLGHLQVELQQGDRGTAVRLTVETEAARQILADAQPRLTAEARAQGVRIAETHVDLSGSGRHAPGDQRRQDDARQTPFIRTATGDAGAETANAARTARRARLDRYA